MKINPKPWKLWRIDRGSRTYSGSFRTRTEAERAIPQLQKAHLNAQFAIDYSQITAFCNGD